MRRRAARSLLAADRRKLSLARALGKRAQFGNVDPRSLIARVGGVLARGKLLVRALAAILLAVVLLVRTLILEAVSASVCPLLAPLFYWRLLTADPQDVATLPNGDITELHYPYRRWVAEELARGEQPWWNQFISAGHSAIGDIQFHAMYPPDYFLATLTGGSLPLRTFEEGVIAHAAIGAFFAYLLGRRLSGSRIGGIAAGLVFGFGGYLTGFVVQQIILLEASVWLPLILLAVDAGASYNLVLPFVVGAGGIALAALAGHPQTLFYVALASAAYTVFRFWNRGRPRLAVLVGGLVMFAGGGGLAASALVPALLHLNLTDRTNVTYSFSNPGFGLHELVGVVFPTEFGGAPLYNGIFTLVLVGIGLAAAYRRADKLFWVGLGLGGLLFSFGGNTFLETIPYLALGSFKLRDHERLSLYVGLAIAVLAAYGVAELIRRRPLRAAWLRRWLRWPLALIGLLVLLNLFQQPTLPSDHYQSLLPLLDRTAFTAIVLVLGLALVVARERRLLNPATVGFLVIAIVGFDLFTTNWQNNLRPGEPDQLLRPNPIVEYLESYPTGEFRISSEGLLPGDGNAGALFRLEDIVGNSPLELKDYADFEQIVPELTRWQVLNVRYVVTKRKLDDPRFHLLRQDGPTNLYELDQKVWLPRANVVEQAILAPSHQDALALVKSADLRTQVVLEGAPDLTAQHLSATAPATGAAPAAATPGLTVGAQLDSVNANDVTLTVNQPESGILVLSDVNYPGWHASIDGAETAIYRANGIVRAVIVPAGLAPRQVRFWFEPPGLSLGTAISQAISRLLFYVVGAEAMLRLVWFVITTLVQLIRRRRKLDVTNARSPAKLSARGEDARIGPQDVPLK
jgi:hypothetical protein